MTLQTQWMTVALMLSSGLLLGVILDTYRVLKLRFHLKGWVVSLVDLLYWTVSAGLVFNLLIWSNWGELRFYIFVAVLAGFFLYYNWFSKQVIKWIRLIIQCIEKIMYWTFLVLHAIFWVPLIHFWAFLRNLAQFLIKLLLILAKNIVKLLSPLEWITRPMRKRLHTFFQPVLTKWHQHYEKLKTWWSKIREKG